MASAEPGVLDIFSNILPLSRLTDEQVVALSGVSQELATTFVRSAYRDLKNNPHASAMLGDLYERSVRSEFPLSDWFREIAHVYAWLEERGRYARLSDVVEYISCGLEGQSGKPNDVVSFYLSTYGFLRSIPLSSRGDERSCEA